MAKPLISLKNLVRYQVVFAVASVSYLLISAYREQTAGEPLSAAPMAPSLILFGLYAASLFLVRIPNKIWYRIAMGLAVFFFGGGGVVGNIVRYLDSGLEQYASFGAWALAVAINSFGTVFNIIAVAGLFRENFNKNN